MTLKDFMKNVPLTRDTRIIVSGDVTFGALVLDTRFTVLSPAQINAQLNNIEGDLNLTSVSVYNNCIWLELSN